MGIKQYKDKSVLERLYWEEGYSIAEIAERFGVSPSTVYRNMKRCGVDRRTSDNEKHPRVKTNQDGYEWVQTKVGDSIKTVQLHRLLGVAEYGFDAVVGNDIHHSNGIPWDNRPSNIEPLERGKHVALHNRGRGK